MQKKKWLPLVTVHSQFSNGRGNRVKEFANQERERAKMDCLDELMEGKASATARSPKAPASMASVLPSSFASMASRTAW
jgi:hypothetical protein